jgi:hypothetical protein
VTRQNQRIIQFNEMVMSKINVIFAAVFEALSQHS